MLVSGVPPRLLNQKQDAPRAIPLARYLMKDQLNDICEQINGKTRIAYGTTTNGTVRNHMQ